VRKPLALVLTLTAAAVWLPHGARAESVQEKLDKARAEQESAQKALSKAEDHLRDVLGAYERLRGTLAQAAGDTVQTYALQDSISEQLAQAKDRLDARVTAAYELGPGGAIEMFLGARDAADIASVQVFAANTFQVDDSTVTEVTSLQQTLDGVIARRETADQQVAAEVARVQKLAEDAASEEADAKKQARAAGLEVQRLEKEQQELEEARAAAAAALGQYLGSGEVGAGCSSGAVHDMIVEAFSPLGQDQVNTALVVATRESNCRPDAWNPMEVPPYGHASGVFQILYPGIWETWSERCGYKGASPFDPQVNVDVAACTVADQGWWPWGF
jgi:predicted  nucleic acid-binding Zn-ribbon protein